MLVSEPPSATPGECKDLGCQIGAIVTDPGIRPGEKPAYVPVVELSKGVRIIEARNNSASASSDHAFTIYI